MEINSSQHNIFWKIFLFGWILTRGISAFASTGATFLREDILARPIGLGGAYVAVAEGSGGLLWNPAGAAFIDGGVVETGYLSGVLDTSQTFLGLVVEALGGGVALHARGIFSGTADLVTGSGLTRTVRAEDSWVLGASYAVRIYSGISLGVTFKWLTSTLAEQYTATSWGMDGGLLISLGGISVGASVQNYGSPVTFISEGDPLPQTLRLGVGWNARLHPDHSFLLSTEMNKVINDIVLGWEGGVGLEWQGYRHYRLRCGVQRRPDGDFMAFGAGVRLEGWRLDLAFSQTSGDLSKSYFSVGWDWGRKDFDHD